MNCWFGNHRSQNFCKHAAFNEDSAENEKSYVSNEGVHWHHHEFVLRDVLYHQVGFQPNISANYCLAGSCGQNPYSLRVLAELGQDVPTDGLRVYEGDNRAIRTLSGFFINQLVSLLFERCQLGSNIRDFVAEVVKPLAVR